MGHIGTKPRLSCQALRNLFCNKPSTNWRLDLVRFIVWACVVFNSSHCQAELCKQWIYLCASYKRQLKLLHLFLLVEPNVYWKPEPASSLAQQHPSRVLMSQQWTNELKGTSSLCTSLLLTILKAKRKAQLFPPVFKSIWFPYSVWPPAYGSGSIDPWSKCTQLHT